MALSKISGNSFSSVAAANTNIDAKTFFLNAVADSVGIGKEPENGVKLDVGGVISSNSYIRVMGSTLNPYLRLSDSASNTAYVQVSDGNLDLWSNRSVSFAPGQGVKGKVDTNGAFTMPYQPAMVANGNGGGIAIPSGATINTSTHTSLRNTWYNGTNPWNGSRFTCPVAGRYYCHTWGNAHTTSGNVMSIRFLRSGSTTISYVYMDSAISGAYWVNIGNYTVIDCSAGDYIELVNTGPANLYFDSGGWCGFGIGLIC